MRMSVLCVSLMLLVPGLASAQQSGERHAVFAPSPDHDRVEFQVPVVTSYELSIIPATGAAPAPLDLGKPSPVNGEIAVNVHAYLAALPAGTHQANVRAIGPGGASMPSANVAFTLAPRVPGVPGSLQILIRTATETETLVDAATGAVLDQRTTSRTTTEVIER